MPTTRLPQVALDATKLAAPGDYVQVTASYPYEPIFSQASVASLLTTPITKTAWMRLN